MMTLPHFLLFPNFRYVRMGPMKDKTLLVQSALLWIKGLNPHCLKGRRLNTQWFGVKLLFESLHSGDADPHKIDEGCFSDLKLYEETIVLIQAESLEQANSIALSNAVDMEHSYPNQYGEQVEWRFVQLIDAFELFEQSLKNGTEVYSRFILAKHSDTTEEIISRYFPEADERNRDM